MSMDGISFRQPSNKYRRMAVKCRRMVVKMFGLSLASYIFMCLLLIRIAARSGLGKAGWAQNAPQRQRTCLPADWPRK